MKKILSILLLLACVFSVVSCDRGKDSGFKLSNYEAYFASSIPTKTVTKISQSISTTTLNSEIVMISGNLADGTKASIYESSIQTFNDIESVKLNYIQTTESRQWYCEGKGISTNKGRTWNAEGVDFAPADACIDIKLDSSLYTNIAYDKATDTLVLQVPAANAKTVLSGFVGEDESFDYDTTITITAAGGRISNIKLEYVVDSYDIGEDIANMIEIEDITVVIDVAYSYDYQTISFG